MRYVLAVVLLLNQAVEDDITELTAEEAAVVTQSEGPLELNGLTTLSDEAANALRGDPTIGLPAKFPR